MEIESRVRGSVDGKLLREGILIYWLNGIVAKGQDLSSQRWRIRNVTRYQEWRNSP